MDDDSELQRTAIHEAGHAVMQVRKSAPIGVASIVPKDHALGHVTHEEPDWNKKKAADHVLISLAGWAALEALNLPGADAGCEDDFEKVSRMLAGWKLGSFSQWRAKALRMMRQPRNRRAVKAVADALLVHRRLWDDHIDLIVLRTDGKMTEAEFAFAWAARWAGRRGSARRS